MKNLSKNLIFLGGILFTILALYLKYTKNNGQLAKEVKQAQKIFTQAKQNQSSKTSKDASPKKSAPVQKKLSAKKANVLLKAAVKSKTISNNQLASDREKLIWNKIKNKSEITVPELLNLNLAVTDRTLRRDMEKLQLKGFVKQVGATKNSKYLILQK